MQISLCCLNLLAWLLFYFLNVIPTLVLSLLHFLLSFSVVVSFFSHSFLSFFVYVSFRCVSLLAFCTPCINLHCRTLPPPPSLSPPYTNGIVHKHTLLSHVHVATLPRTHSHPLLPSLPPPYTKGIVHKHTLRSQEHVATLPGTNKLKSSPCTNSL